MNTCLNQLIDDEAGFIVSAELVLVSTIAVLGMIVGLSEVSLNVNNELEDVGSAVGGIEQSYQVHCLSGHKAQMFGSSFWDQADHCDGQFDVN